MNVASRILMATVIASSVTVPLSVYATNGMHPEGNGIKSRGMGGAGVALGAETASVVTNPATVTDIGKRFDISLGIFSPQPRRYTLTGNVAGFDNAQTSDSNSFYIPFVGYNQSINEKMAWSFVMNANGGLNSDYPMNFGANNFGLPGRTGIDLAQLFMNFTFGYKPNDVVSLGITGIVASQTFKANGLQAFAGASSNADKLSNNGYDNSHGFGVKVGAKFNIGSVFSIGLAYQPEIDMSEFDEYKGLFADQGDLDVPPVAAFGMAWHASENLTLAFDYVFIGYEEVPTISNSATEFTEKGKPFGSDDGPGFGWESINVYKLGMEYKIDKDWNYRLGWNHGENPIPSDEVSVNFLAPGVVRNHFTLGVTNHFSKTTDINFVFVHTFHNSVKGEFAAPFGGGEMEIEMEQNFFEFGYTSKF